MAAERVLLVGFDPSEAQPLADCLGVPCLCHSSLPPISIQDGELSAPPVGGGRSLRCSHVVFHGIFEHDLEFLAGLALWGGPCFPNANAMMDCRLRLPCLVRALRLTRFGTAPRGFVFSRGDYLAESESVAKWGNWHCGDNKQRFHGIWTAEEPTLVEPFMQGEAVRVAVVKEPRQIRLAGEGWLKSVHGMGAEFMELDPELAADTLAIQQGLGLDILANDYMLTPDGPQLLEVNHIPSVTCFPELWEDYLNAVSDWFRLHRRHE